MGLILQRKLNPSQDTVIIISNRDTEVRVVNLFSHAQAATLNFLAPKDVHLVRAELDDHHTPTPVGGGSPIWTLLKNVPFLMKVTKGRTSLVLRHSTPFSCEVQLFG